MNGSSISLKKCRGYVLLCDFAIDSVVKLRVNSYLEQTYTDLWDKSKKNVFTTFFVAFVISLIGKESCVNVIWMWNNNKNHYSGHTALLACCTHFFWFLFGDCLVQEVQAWNKIHTALWHIIFIFHFEIVPYRNLQCARTFTELYSCCKYASNIILLYQQTHSFRNKIW